MKLDYDEIPCFDNEEKLLDANKSWDNLIKYHRHDLIVDKKHLKQTLSLGMLILFINAFRLSFHYYHLTQEFPGTNEVMCGCF